MKIMELEERMECIAALTSWFDSQNVEPASSMVIMMELSAILLGATAPTTDDLEKALEAFEKDSRAIALRSYAEIRKCVK